MLTSAGLERQLQPLSLLPELEQLVRSLCTTVTEETTSLRSAVLGGSLRAGQLSASMNSLTTFKTTLLQEMRRTRDAVELQLGGRTDHQTLARTKERLAAVEQDLAQERSLAEQKDALAARKIGQLRKELKTARLSVKSLRTSMDQHRISKASARRPRTTQGRAFEQGMASPETAATLGTYHTRTDSRALVLYTPEPTSAD